MLKEAIQNRVCYVVLLAMLCTPFAFAADGAKSQGSSKVSIGGTDGQIDAEVELKIGDVAPDFTLPNLATDKMESLKDYLGKPIILFFIQSACYSCLQEAKALKTLKEQYPGIEVIAIGVDLLGKPMLVSWASHNKINYPVLLDPIFAVPEKYGFTFTPSSVLIDKAGKIAFIHSGFRPSDIAIFEEKIKDLLK
jgi:peroxiredoxin